MAIISVGGVFVALVVVLATANLRLDSAERELVAIQEDQGFASTPSEGREIRLERNPYCGNPGFDDYPPTILRTLEVPTGRRAVAQTELRRALRDAGWLRAPVRHSSPNDWRRDFGGFTASLSIKAFTDEYAYVPTGHAWLELVAVIRDPDFCKRN